MPSYIEIPPWKGWPSERIPAHTVSGPLAVAQGYHQREREFTGYWRIYHLESRLPFGPSFATAKLAVAAMKKVLGWGLGKWQRTGKEIQADEPLKFKVRSEIGEKDQVIHE